MKTRIKIILSKTQIDFEISKRQPRSTRYEFSIRTTAPPGGGGGGGVGGTQQIFIRVRLRPKVQPLSLLSTIFQEKVTPFVYRLLLTNSTPFTYLV